MTKMTRDEVLAMLSHNKIKVVSREKNFVTVVLSDKELKALNKISGKSFKGNRSAAMRTFISLYSGLEETNE